MTQAIDGSESRFAAYVQELASVIGHADRADPLRAYCTGLLTACGRKSVEPMAAVTAPARTAAQHQSLLHFVGNGPWSDEAVLGKVRELVLPKIERHGAIEAWIIDDTGMPKKGRHSVGVARQYCGQLGKQDNCHVAVSLSLANHYASLPVSYRLYLPEEWAADAERRQAARVPEEVRFKTKPQIALDLIRKAHKAGLPAGAVLMDAAYGCNTAFRTSLSKLGMRYVAGILSNASVWTPGTAPRPPKPWSGRGRPPTRQLVDAGHRPVSVKSKRCPGPTFCEAKALGMMPAHEQASF
jgi:SRSO17 transposase